MSLKYWTGDHTKRRLMYHITWISKYHKRVLKGKVAKRFKQILYNATQINQWWIEELEILNDYVHILTQIHPDEKLSTVVNFLKGGSSKIIRKEFPDLEEFVWGKSLWEKGYFAETMGSLNYSNVKKYIQNQRQEYATDSTSTPE